MQLTTTIATTTRHYNLFQSLVPSECPSLPSSSTIANATPPRHYNLFQSLPVASTLQNRLVMRVRALCRFLLPSLSPSSATASLCALQQPLRSPFLPSFASPHATTTSSSPLSLQNAPQCPVKAVYAFFATFLPFGKCSRHV